ncbi:MAG: Nif3-like dinuclear metal center hexameric protein [Synergistaceae bacterium]|nr:Nif3-like dinuclear metal center hexameric protein [Synergistaceae bacterium]
MKVRDLLNHIDTFAPFALAEEWDNSGLQVGSYDAEVKRVGLCLDAVPEAVVEAEKQNCEVLLTHHPLIFRAVKKINVDIELGKTIQEALTRKINIVAAHTNWDKADEGVNFTLAELLGLTDIKPLGDFGLIGKLWDNIDKDIFLKIVKEAWNLSWLDFYSENSSETRTFGVPCEIFKVALCGGSGAEFWRAAKLHKADIYLTADMKYHELIDATRAGLSIGICDHGEMERASLFKLAEKISACGVETVIFNINALLERGYLGYY